MKKPGRLLSGAVLAASLLSSAPSLAGDRFLVVPFDSLRFETAAEPPAPTGGDALAFRDPGDLDAYVVLDVPGEAYLDFQGSSPWGRDPRRPARCALRVAEGAAISGRIFLAQPGNAGFAQRRFTLEAAPEDPAARESFFAVMEGHYRELLDRGLPGAAWFRHRARVARANRAARERDAEEEERAPSWRWRPRGFEDTFDLFTGGRALTENLDLDRALIGLKDEKPDVDIATIEGVTTRAMDWKALVQGKKPDVDALARAIPADQHGVFFPSFGAMVAVFDEIDRAGTPLLQFAGAQVEDLRTKERYQEQLCLPLSTVSRLLGPAVVASVAITGSDPYLPTGTDLALLFDCKEPALLEGLLQARHLEARAKGAKPVDGTAGQIRYAGVRSDDRVISSYVARVDSTIVVSNSPAQLERIAAALEGGAPALATADEFVWFRDRYRKGDPEESALLVLTDATIRRWAGPQSRIGDSRRIRAAAAMAEIQARHVDDLVSGTLVAGSSAADPKIPWSADFVWERDGVRSPKWGRPTFLTPLSEIPIDRVTPSERDAYAAFRTTFQNRWRTVFDPIAVRLSFGDDRLGADATVLPLALGTEYREFRELTRDATLAPDAGDAHPGTLLHLALAFGKGSELGRMFSESLGPFARQLGADPLGWIGAGAALYADQDPFWGELSAAQHGPFLQGNFYRLPVALHVEVEDPLKLAAFLTALRALANGAAPGMARWETKTWQGQSYVKIAAGEASGLDGPAAQAAIYYAAMPDAFVLSMREDLVHHSIDRRLARKAGKADPARPWLGSSLALRVDREALGIFEGLGILGGLGANARSSQLQRAAWSALPILNEWKRRFPAEDPVRLHERLFGARLATPSRGSFSWNESMQTMETSDYGSPAAPKEGPGLPAAFAGFLRGEFGLTFEGDGLRARVEIEREKQ